MARGQIRRVRRGARHQVHLAPYLLFAREVGGQFTAGIETILLHVAHHADNGQGPFRFPPKMFAEGIIVRPEAFGELLVDDGGALAVTGVTIVEVAALQQGNLHRAKVIGAGGPQVHLQFLARLRMISLHVDAAPSYRAGERQYTGLAFGRYSGQMCHTAVDIAKEPSSDFVVVVFRIARIHLHREHALGGESRRHILQAHKAADQQSRPHQQHRRKRQFGNHQQAAQPVARYQQSAIGLAAAAAGFKRRTQVQLEGAPCRRQAEQQPGHGRDAEREQQHGTVDGESLMIW